MKDRIVSGVIIAAIALVMAAFSKFTVVLRLLMALLSLAALSEIFVASGWEKRKAVILLGALSSVVIPFLPEPAKSPLFLLGWIAVTVLAAVVVSKVKKIAMGQLIMAVCVSVAIPLFFSSIVWLRMLDVGHVWFYAVFICAWGSDVGGYTFGRLFGRRKLCPTISPNKTTEGLLGCYVMSLTGMLVVGFFCVHVAGYHVNYISLTVFSLLGTTFSVCGDLVASAIKRKLGIKDYGNLIPGHGGIMDRFDSILFAAPAFYLANLITTLVSTDWMVFRV